MQAVMYLEKLNKIVMSNRAHILEEL